MPGIKADWSAMAKFGKACLKASAGVRPAILRAMLKGTALIQKNLKTFIRAPAGGFGRLVSGKAAGLLASWTGSVAEDGLSARVTTPKGYSSVMNSGRRIGATQPPTQAIENWIDDKRIKTPKVKKLNRLQKRIKRAGARIVSRERRIQAKLRGVKARNAGSRKPRVKLTPEQREKAARRGFAWVIARSIKRKGIKGRFYVESAMEASREPLTAIFGGVADVTIKAVLTE